MIYAVYTPYNATKTNFPKRSLLLADPTRTDELGWALVQHEKRPGQEREHVITLADRADYLVAALLENWRDCPRRHSPPATLVRVASYSPDTGIITLGTDQLSPRTARSSLSAWLDHPITDLELHRSPVRSILREEIFSMLTSSDDPIRWEGMKKARTLGVADPANY